MSTTRPNENLSDPSASSEPKANAAFTQNIDWQDFRDHLATADQDGSRRWIYPKKPSGRFYRRRTYLSWALLAVMFLGPFIRINGNPLLMVNILERRFSILGQIFWPQDTFIFAVAMLIFFMGIMVFTTAFGRLWCGWTCPQTLLMEMVFRKLEYLIEGDAQHQRLLAKSPWTLKKLGIKAFKQFVFFALSLLIGNTLLSYIIGSDRLIAIVTDDPRNHLTGLGFMLAFTLLFYTIFARFREQACTFICPYGRFQSALLDENSLVVSYDHRRGEKRAPWHRGDEVGKRMASGAGDCIDCHQCVAVCPTGIDIRNGTQMECVNCTACIDACDSVMEKINRPRGLIRFASQNNIERGEPQRFTPRMKIYSVVLLGLVSLFLFLLFTRADVKTTLFRAPGAMYQLTTDGKISNLYTLKIVNKTSRELPVELRLENVAGKLTIMSGGQLRLPKADLVQSSVLVELDPSSLAGANTPIRVGVYSGPRRLETLETVFVGPR